MQFRLVIYIPILISFIQMAGKPSPKDQASGVDAISGRHQSSLLGFKDNNEPNCMNMNNIIEFSFVAERLKKDINKQLAAYQKRFGEVELMAKTNEKSISNISDQFNSVSFFAMAVLGLVALVLGLGVFRIYMDSRRIRENMRRLAEGEVTKWISKNEGEWLKRMKASYEDYEQFTYFIRLKSIIKRPDSTAEEIFAPLSRICVNPRKEYKRVLTQIVEMKVDPSVTAKAEEALMIIQSQK